MFGLSWLAVSCLVSVVLACEEYTLEYIDISGKVTPLLVLVCTNNQTITYNMPASETFEEVTTYENYILGYGASRVTSHVACYVRLLSKSLDEQISYLEQHQSKPMTLKGDAQMEAIPIADVYEEFGGEVATICAYYPAYTLVKRQDALGETEMER
ncbi:unnamed protein product [Meganyctiphanes norvegica]|uniref:Uncharacterized protein n=1 Tax=Meganyctiphanes norvegica TaxID=48144 RepID=A0AAV2PWZ8_MEGNR